MFKRPHNQTRISLGREFFKHAKISTDSTRYRVKSAKENSFEYCVWNENLVGGLGYWDNNNEFAVGQDPNHR